MREPPNIAEWYSAYADEVYTFLAYFYTRTDVDDLVSETFIRALRGLGSYRQDAAPKTWLMRIARNVAIDHLRRQRPPSASDNLLTEVESTLSDPADTVSGRDNVEQMLKYLTSIKPQYREVVVLRGIMDYSIRDTARILGWSKSKVGVTYHRALGLLREYLNERQGGDDYEIGRI